MLGTLVQVSNTVIHPQYNSSINDYDIGVIILEKPFDLTCPDIASVAMSTSNAATAAGTMARVAGWGTTKEGNLLGSLTLEAVDLPIVGNDVCNAAYGGGITDRMICAGLTEGNIFQ